MDRSNHQTLVLSHKDNLRLSSVKPFLVEAPANALSSHSEVVSKRLTLLSSLQRAKLRDCLPWRG